MCGKASITNYSKTKYTMNKYSLPCIYISWKESVVIWCDATLEDQGFNQLTTIFQRGDVSDWYWAAHILYLYTASSTQLCVTIYTASLVTSVLTSQSTDHDITYLIVTYCISVWNYTSDDVWETRFASLLSTTLRIPSFLLWSSST